MKTSTKLRLFQDNAPHYHCYKGQSLEPKTPRKKALEVLHSQRASPPLCPRGWLFLRKGTNRPQWTPSGFTSVLSPPRVHLPLLFIYEVLKVLKQRFCSEVLFSIDVFGTLPCPRRIKHLPESGLQTQ